MLHPNPAVVRPQRAAWVRASFGDAIMVCRTSCSRELVRGSCPDRRYIPARRQNVIAHNSLFFKTTSEKSGLTPGPASSKKLLLKPPPAPRGGDGEYRNTSAAQNPPALAGRSRPRSHVFSSINQVAGLFDIARKITADFSRIGLYFSAPFRNSALSPLPNPRPAASTARPLQLHTPALRGRP